MLLHVDGARICNAAAALDVPLRAIATDARVDALSFGATKNGVLLGEAVVFLRPELAGGFAYLRKQTLQLASKGRYLAAQYIALLEGDLWRRNAAHANAMAARLASAIADVPGVRITQAVAGQRRAGRHRARRRAGAAARLPLLRLGRAGRRGPLDVLVGHHARRGRRVRSGDRADVRRRWRGMTFPGGHGDLWNSGPPYVTSHSAHADDGNMGMSNLMERSYRIGRDGITVVCDAIAVRGEIDAFRDALAWRRDQLARVDHDAADDVLALRAWMTLDDMLSATDVFGDEAPLTVTRDQAQMLCELAASYVTERDVESYQPVEERERIAILRALSGPLMDCCCEFGLAQEEARALREPPLPV